MIPLKHETIVANDIRMHYVTAGTGPLVLLLHGFPQFWYTWRKQIPELAKQFQVVAPDLRGYGDTEKPPTIEQYQSHYLVEDVAALIKALGHEKAHFVGHDWGGSVAWKTAMHKPEMVDRLAVLNCPHPHIMAQALRSNLQQLRKSWYFFFFQIPYLPEIAFKIQTKKTLENLFRGSAVKKEAFTDEDIDQYTEALHKPGALTAAFNYYRAAFREAGKKRQDETILQKISAPSLLIWGEKDIALGKELTYGMEPLFSGPFRIEYLPEASHWVNEEQPEKVNQLLIEFLTSK